MKIIKHYTKGPMCGKAEEITEEQMSDEVHKYIKWSPEKTMEAFNNYGIQTDKALHWKKLMPLEIDKVVEALIEKGC